MSIQFKLTKSALVAASIVSLSACGGGSSGGGGNGLLPEAQGCAYLLDSISAAELNSGGCAYTDEDGNTQYWAGTSGIFGPGFNDPDNGGNTDNSGGTDNGENTDNGGNTDNGDNTDDGGTVIDPQGGSGISFPEVQVFGSELADNGRGNVYSDAANSALISGPIVGSGISTNSNLYRSIPFVTEDFPPEFELLHALVWNKGYSDNVGLLMHLQNKSFETRCFVRHGEIQAYDSAGSVISDGLLSFGYAEGSQGFATNGTTTDTCIGPNEIVYLTDLFSESIQIDQVAGVKISEITSREATTSTIRVEPVSYQVNAGQLDVTIANRSVETVDLGSSMILAITDNGVPIHSNLELHSIRLLPGEETVISYLDYFRGSVNTIRVLLDYEPVQ